MKAIKGSTLPFAVFDLVLSGGASNIIGIVACAYAILMRLPTKQKLPRRIIGTSAGSLGGILIAAGFTPAEALAFFHRYLRNDALLDGSLANIPTRLGWCAGNRLRSAIREAVGNATLKELQVPLEIVVGDLYAGKPLVLNATDHPDARVDDCGVASSSMPLFFGMAEVRGAGLGNRKMTDGGAAMNFAMNRFDDDTSVPTIGVRVRSNDSVDPIRGFDVKGFVRAMARLLLWSSDNAHLSKKNYARVVDFVGGDGLDFSLTPEEIDRRWTEGWNAGLMMDPAGLTAPAP